MKIELDGERQTITVNGVPISLEVLETLTNPDCTKVYRFKRQENDSVIVEGAAAEVNCHCFGAMCDDLGPGCVTPPVEEQ
jgi:hypothetical protein